MGLAGAAPALDIPEFERPQRRGHAPSDRSAADLCQLHGRTADVADQAVGARPAQQDTLCRQSGLFLAVDDRDMQPCLGQNFLTELRTVFRLAHGGGGHNVQSGQAKIAGQVFKAPQRRQRTYATARVQPAGFRQPGAKLAHDFFVVEISG